MAPADRRVVRVTPDLWRTYREVRLAMLADTPRAFGTTLAEASARTDEQWESFVAQAHLWLAYADDAAIGSVGAWADPDLPVGSTYLVGMWVAPGHRGGGVGDALVGAVLDHARASGFARVVLDVTDENARARRFYERLGFAPTGRTSTMPWDDSVTESELARPVTSRR